MGSFPEAQGWDNFRQRGQHKQTASSGQAGTLQQFRAAEACEAGSEHRGFFTRMYLRQRGAEGDWFRQKDWCGHKASEHSHLQLKEARKLTQRLWQRGPEKKL